MPTAILPRVLYVDTDRPSRDFFEKWLARNTQRCSLVCAADAAEALEKISIRPFDFYLFEYCLGEMTGPELCQRIRLSDNRTPVVICSPLSRDIDRNTALRAGATAYVVKPDDLARLSAIMRRFLGQAHKPRQFHTLRRCSAII